MEPEVTICCGKKNRKCGCIDLSIIIISVLLAFVLGVIIAVQTTIIDLVGIVYFYAVLTILAVLLILGIVYKICNCKKPHR